MPGSSGGDGVSGRSEGEEGPRGRALSGSASWERRLSVWSAVQLLAWFPAQSRLRGKLPFTAHPCPPASHASKENFTCHLRLPVAGPLLRRELA